MNTLVLKFKTKEGKNSTMRIPNVKDGITSVETDALMDLIISKNIFFEAGKELVEKDGAEMDTTVSII